jgi:DNA-binding NtrC family response regulator
MNHKLLLIEDTATLQMIYCANLMGAGHEVDVASTGAQGLEMFQSKSNSVVIMDLFLPDMDGVEVIRKLVQENPQAKIIVITSNGSVNRAVEAMRAGAFDFLLKPFSDERLLATVSLALASVEVRPEIDLETGNFYGFLGRGPIMQDLYRKIMRIAPSTAPVFVVGERGAGKDTCARAIHDHSGPKSRPFLKYNGTGLSQEAQEKTLFGDPENFEAQDNRNAKGALYKAYGGTLYISEVSELDPLMQSRLATYLRENNQSDTPFDGRGEKFPRIICSTSVDPHLLLETGKIREDLFYQLHVLSVEVPPLRILGDDINYVACAMLERFSRAEQKSFTGLSDTVADAFLTHSWPGNINQLENLLHKTVATYEGDLIAIEMLPIGFAGAGKKKIYMDSDMKDNRYFVDRSNNAIHHFVGLPLEELEAKFIEATIQSQDGSIPKAAEILGVAPSTIYRKRSRP